jgi:hypothetical protein
MSQMSAATARVGARAPRRTPTPPSLRVVSGADTKRPGAGFALLCVTLLSAGLLGLLLLNTSLAQGAFALHDLQATSGELSDTQAALTQQLQAASSPQQLAREATAMGMVPSQSAAFLRLSDGAVFGVAKPARKQAGFTVVGQVVVPPATAAVAPVATAMPAAKAGTTTAVTVRNGVTTTVVTVVLPDGSTRTTTTTTRSTGASSASGQQNKQQKQHTPGPTTR